MEDNPAYRFSVVYKDGRIMDQENDEGKIVRDHVHIEDWDNVNIYALRNRSGDHVISVNFTTGDFAINNHVIKMMLSDMDMYMEAEHNTAVFKPICGRRIFNGEMGRSVYFYCGWETKLKNRKIKRVMYVSEQGLTFFETKGG